MVDIHDYIVVGSGASGGLLASNLHRLGADVLLIEAGKAYDKKNFPNNEMRGSAALYWGGGFEFDSEAKTAYLRSRCLGGTTIVNQALLDRFDEDVFNDWKNRTGISWMEQSELDKSYEAVESRLKLKTFEDKDMNNNARLFKMACEKLGYDWKYLRRGQDDCALERGNDCIACLNGCHRDSKQSTLVTSLQKAMQDGMKVQTETEVLSVEHHADRCDVHVLTASKKAVLKCRKLIMAAGSFGTTQVLLRSGFDKKLKALGKGFCQHPQFMFFGVFDEIVDGYKGAFQTLASGKHPFRKNGYKLEVVYAPPISAGMLLSSYGAEFQKQMKRYRYMSSIEVAVRDEPDGGRLRINRKGRLIVEKYLTAQDKSRKAAGAETLKKIFTAQGAKEILESPFFFGLHLMGGCAIGSSGVNSVVNPEFQVHDMPNIYIADSSIFPSAPGINPSLSVMAFSHRLLTQLSNA